MRRTRAGRRAVAGRRRPQGSPQHQEGCTLERLEARAGARTSSTADYFFDWITDAAAASSPTRRKTEAGFGTPVTFRPVAFALHFPPFTCFSCIDRSTPPCEP